MNIDQTIQLAYKYFQEGNIQQASILFMMTEPAFLLLKILLKK